MSARIVVDYEDACYQQEASARADHAYMMRDRVLPDQIHNFAHNNEWLIRNLVFVASAKPLPRPSRSATLPPARCARKATSPGNPVTLEIETTGNTGVCVLLSSFGT